MKDKIVNKAVELSNDDEFELIIQNKKNPDNKVTISKPMYFDVIFEINILSPKEKVEAFLGLADASQLIAWGRYTVERHVTEHLCKCDVDELKTWGTEWVQTLDHTELTEGKLEPLYKSAILNNKHHLLQLFEVMREYATALDSYAGMDTPVEHFREVFMRIQQSFVKIARSAHMYNFSTISKDKNNTNITETIQEEYLKQLCDATLVMYW